MKIFAAVMLSLLLLVGCPEPAQEGVVMIANDDKEMNAAIAQARATLDEFLTLAKTPPAGASDFKLKVKVVDGEHVEHLWVMPFEGDGKKFSGIIVNEPELVSTVRYGKQYQFTQEQISDWGYELNGKQKGSYTICVILKNMPATEAKVYRDDYGLECKE